MVGGEGVCLWKFDFMGCLGRVLKDGYIGVYLFDVRYGIWGFKLEWKWNRE